MKNLQKRGFTLMELLVVVLIVGILTTVAVSQYRRAVLKSRYAALMPIAKAIADSNEVYYLGHGNYADSLQSLPVQGRSNYPDGTELKFGTDADYAYVLAKNEVTIPHNRYIVYQKHSGKFADNIHCEAHQDDTQAQELCMSLGGEYIPGSISEEFFTYALSGTRGNSDKFPPAFTSLLAACEESATCSVIRNGDETTLQDCSGNLSGTNIKTCVNTTYDEDGEQTNYVKTEQQCGQTVRVTVTGSMPNYVQYTPGREQYTNACITRGYDENEQQIDYTAMYYCGGGNARVVNGKCVRTNWTSGSTMDEHYNDEAGWETQFNRIYCLTANANGTCAVWDTVNSVFNHTEPEGKGVFYQAWTNYCATFNADGTCATYDAARSYEVDYKDPQGCAMCSASSTGTRKTCATLNADGSCATYSAKYNRDGNYLYCSAENGNMNIYTGECL